MKNCRRQFINLSLILASAAALASVVADAQVTKALRVHAIFLPGNALDATNLSVVLDYQGFPPGRIDNPQHEAFRLWQGLQTDAKKIGAVAAGLETGPQRDSFVVSLPKRKSGASLVTTGQPASRPKELANAYAMAGALARNEGLLQPGRQTHSWYQLTSGQRADVGRFLVCVGLDYRVNVDKSMVLPPFLKPLMDEICAGPAGLLAKIDRDLELVSSTPFEPDSDMLVEHIDDQSYFDLAFLGESTNEIGGGLRLCSNAVLRNVSELKALQQAGWIRASSRIETDDVMALNNLCSAFLADKIFTKMPQILDGMLASLPLEKPITAYSKMLLNELLQAHAPSMLYSQEELVRLVKETFGRPGPGRESLVSEWVSSADLNIKEFGEFVAAGEQLTPDEWLVLLLTTDKLPVSHLRNALTSLSEDAQLNYIQRLKGVLSTACRLEDFTPKCLVTGAFNLDRSQLRLSIDFQQDPQPFFDGYGLLLKGGA